MHQPQSQSRLVALKVLDSAQVLNADVALPSSRPQPVLMLLRQILTTRPADRPDVDAILAQLELWSTQGFAGPKAKPSQSDEAAPRGVHPAVPQKNGSWTPGWKTDMWEDRQSPMTDVDGVQQRLDSSASAASATSSSGPSVRAAADSNALCVAPPLEASSGKGCLAGQFMNSLKTQSLQMFTVARPNDEIAGAKCHFSHMQCCLCAKDAKVTQMRIQKQQLGHLLPRRLL